MMELEPNHNNEPAPGRPWLALRLLAVLLLVLAGLGALWFWSYAAGAGPARTETLVYIPPGSSFAAIERQLAEAGLLHPDRRFGWLAVLSGQRSQLRAGEYAIPAGASPRAILELLAAGRTFRRQVTIPEGANLYQVAEILAGQQLLEASAFIAMATAPPTPAFFGLEAPTLEGWLFPDTYYFTRGQRMEEITRVLVERARRVLTELLAELGNDTGLDPLEIMTLASIVEKETGLPGERALIAGVFFNRLERGMRLQTDPTVIYGRQSFDRRLTREDLRTPTPYNTYVIFGLPPGPIANPGRAAIAAVLRPEQTDYLYFVSRNDGSHQFSTNLRDHNRAVQRYQR